MSVLTSKIPFQGIVVITKTLLHDINVKIGPLLACHKQKPPVL